VAQATFIEQMAIDAKAIALCNTVTADPPGILAIHYNPAGLTLMPEGKYVTTGATIPIVKISSRYDADPDFEGFLGGYNNDPLAGTEGTNTSGQMYVPIVNGEMDFLVSPVLGMSYRKPKSRWTFALGNYTPFAVGFAHDDALDPVRYGARHAYAQHFVYMAPSVSYQLTDTLSLGMTVGVGQTAVGVGLDMRSPNDLVTLTRVLGDATEDLEIPVLSELTFPPPWFGGGLGPYDHLASLELATRDDFSPNYNIGLLWRPEGWFSLGLVYQSAIKAQLTGRYQIDYTDQFQNMIEWFGSSPTLLTISGMLNLPFDATPSQSGTVSAEYNLPQRVQAGIKVKPFERLSLLADVHWADWSTLKEDRFVFDQDIQLLQLVKVLGYTGGNRSLVLPREFKDTWHWSVGLQYRFTDWLTVFLGYERRPTSVSPAHFDNIYSLPDLDSYGGGCSLTFENGLQLDLGFAYLVNDAYVVGANGSDLLNSTDPFKPVYNPYAGLIYRQKTETYMGSFKVTMPLEVMSAMLHDTLSLLNPFSAGAKHTSGAARPQLSAPAAAEPMPALPQTRAASPPSAPDVRYTLQLAVFESMARAVLAGDFYRIQGFDIRVHATGQGYALLLGDFAGEDLAWLFQSEHDLSEAQIVSFTPDDEPAGSSSKEPE